MNNKELLLFAESISNSKNISQAEVFLALEAGLSKASEKQHSGEPTVTINHLTGDWETKSEDGDVLENITVSRIHNQIIKNTLFATLNKFSDSHKLEKLLSLVGLVVNGAVRRVNRGSYIVDVNGIDCLMPFSECLPGEKFKSGEIVSVVVKKTENKGVVKIILGRKDKELVIELLSMEVPEIAEGAIEVMACSRDAGFRSRVVVRARDGRIDAIGTCVGMRGVRAKSITQALGGEFIEFIEWMEDDYSMMTSVLCVDEVTEIIINDDSIHVIVADDSIGRAIGKHGINVRMASELFNSKVQVFGLQASKDKCEKIYLDKCTNLTNNIPSITQDQGGILIDNEIETIEDISTITTDEMSEILSITDAESDVIIDFAMDILLVDAMKGSEDWDQLYDLIDDDEITDILGTHNIKNIIDLSDLCVDELEEMTGTNRDWCAEIIIESRKVMGVI